MNSEAFDRAYKGLNAEQRAAVDAVDGPVMVNAGPGTGKTQILTLRIANILRTTDTKPEQVLALTFTNAGSFAMRERLVAYIGDTGYRVNIFTFHAFCEHVIRGNPFYFPLLEGAQVVDDLEKVRIIESVIDTGEFDLLLGGNDRYQKVRDISRAVETVKKEGLSPEKFRQLIPAWKEELLADDNLYYKRKYKQFNAGDIKPAELEKVERRIAQALELARLYELYQEQLGARRLYDFSDMILGVLEKLRTDEDFRYDLQEQYQYLLVDEHQDTNAGQNELVELLTAAEHLDGRPNVFTVGDEKQSIYRFQGASEETFRHFEGLYRDVRHISLVENYRSVQAILSASHTSVTHSVPAAVPLHANKDHDRKVEVGQFTSYKLELLYVADQIRQAIAAGVPAGEIAILYRANKHLPDIKQALGHAGIPFSVHSKDSVFDDADIRNVLTVLRVAANPTDEESLGKALFAGFLKIGGYDAVKVLNARTAHARQGKTLLDVISSQAILEEIGVGNAEPFLAFSRCLEQAMIDSRNEHILEFLRNFLQQVGYFEYMLSSSLSQDKMLRLDALFDEIRRQNRRGEFGLADLIKMADSYKAYGLDIRSESPELEAGVQLMTAHGSKGREFEQVYMVNTTRSSWEGSRSFPGIALPVKDYKGDVHDERRLFYVAMTRAKERLSITYSKSDWEGKEQEKSMFISELPDDLVETVDTASVEKAAAAGLSAFLLPLVERRSVYEPAFVRNLFLKRGLTVTALNAYLSCPVKYFYKHLVRIPSGYSAVLEYGNTVHAALEKFFSESRRTEALGPAERLVELFDLELDRADLREADRIRYRLRGRQSLAAWYENRKPQLSFRILTEQHIQKDMLLAGGETLTLRGIVDKIEFVDGELEGPINLVDYKTGKPFSKKNREQRADLERQLAFYHLLIEGYRDGAYRINRAILDFIEPLASGQSETKDISVGEDDLAELRQTVEAVSADIMSGEFLERGCGRRDCEWCALHASVKRDVRA